MWGGWDASSYHKRRMDGAVDGWDRHEERVAINLFPAIINLRMIHRARERAQEFLMVAAVESAHGHLSVIGHLLGSLPLSLSPSVRGTAGRRMAARKPVRKSYRRRHAGRGNNRCAVGFFHWRRDNLRVKSKTDGIIKVA